MTLADLIGRAAEEVKKAHAERCRCGTAPRPAEVVDTSIDPDCLALRARLREALRALVEAWPCPGHPLSYHTDETGCVGMRAAALKKLEA